MSRNLARERDHWRAAAEATCQGIKAEQICQACQEIGRRDAERRRLASETSR